MSEKEGKIYKFGEFTLDANDLSLMRGEEILSLTQKALKTLLFLVENHQRIVTREELLETVWQNAFVEENVLSVNISNLRKAFGENKESRFIRTIPRKGYQFVAPIETIDNSRNESPAITENAEINLSTNAEKDAEILFVERHKRTEIIFEKDATNNQLALPPAKINSKKRTIIYSLLALAAVVLIFGGWIRLNRETKIDSIAVLPLKSIAPNETDKALGLGLADSLISRLGNLRKMTVRPLSAVNKYLENETPSVDFAKDLQVDAVLEGTFQRHENRLRVNVRLLRVADGTQIWTGIFDETETDIFKLQDSLSEQVVKSLRWNLTADERETLAKRPTENVRAYELYLKGQYFWNKRTASDLKKAADFYEQAIALDANYAEAYVGLADSQYLLYDYSYELSLENPRRAKDNLLKALALQPDSAKALTTLGLIQSSFDWDWDAAEKSFVRALEIEPNSASVHQRYGTFLIKIRRFSEAQTEIERARQLDPLSLSINMNLGVSYFFAGNFDIAESHFNSTLEIEPNFTPVYWYLARLKYQKKDFKAFFANNETAIKMIGEETLANKIHQKADVLPPHETIRFWFEEWKRGFPENKIGSHDLAIVSSYLENRDETLFWLEKSVAEKHPWCAMIVAEPEFVFLRGDPRFQKILQTINLAE